MSMGIFTTPVSGFTGSRFRVQGERKGLASVAEIRDEEPAASMDLSAGCAVLCGTKSPRPPFPKGETPAPSYSPFSKGGWGDFKSDFIGRDHQYIGILRAYGFKNAGNPC
jgi:hypothetical protein